MSDKQLMITAGIGIALIVGIVALLSGDMTGNSFAINAISAPMTSYRAMDFSGYEYGPYQIPWSTEGFLKAKRYCTPSENNRLGYPFNHYECCVSMCSDVCDIRYYPRPGTCVNQCVRACNQ